MYWAGVRCPTCTHHTPAGLGSKGITSTDTGRRWSKRIWSCRAAARDHGGGPLGPNGSTTGEAMIEHSSTVRDARTLPVVTALVERGLLAPERCDDAAEVVDRVLGSQQVAASPLKRRLAELAGYVGGAGGGRRGPRRHGGRGSRVVAVRSGRGAATPGRRAAHG